MTALLSVSGLVVLAGCGTSPSPTPGSSPTVTAEPSEATTSEAIETPSGVEIPDVAGLDGNAAGAALEVAGFQAEGRWQGDEAFLESAFDAVATTPGAGEYAEPGSVVVVELSVPDLPQYSTELDGTTYRVTVDVLPTEREAKWITWELMQEQREEGGYFVLINCATGGTPSADNRLANGKFAVGALGAAQTGLQEGRQETTALEGSSCP